MERKFMLQALLEGCRLDERPLHSFRDVKISLDREQRGLATVHLGKTKVVAVVTATVTRPYEDRPSEGLINYYAEVSDIALCKEENPYVYNMSIYGIEDGRRMEKKCNG